MAKAHSAVLVVDDDMATRRFIAEALAIEGYDVRAAASGRDALAVLSRWRPDVILLDLLMPEMDGWTFLAYQQEHREFGRIPVIVMSARDNLEREALAAADVVAKPLEVAHLLDRVRLATH